MGTNSRDLAMAQMYLESPQVTYQDVASEFGVHVSTAHRGVRRGIESLGERDREGVDVRRHSAIARYEAMIEAEPQDTVESRKLVLQIQRRLDKLTGVEDYTPTAAPNLALLRSVLRGETDGDGD